MNKTLRNAAVAAAAVLFLLPAVWGQASTAANKTSAAGSTTEFLGGTSPTVASVLDTTIKTSAPQDLIFSVTLECALWTTVATTGNDVSEATARVTIRVLFDGAAVPVDGKDTDGSVVFCDRTHRQSVSNLDPTDDTRIEQFLRTREANGFNWLLPDVGSGVHTVSVQATLETQTSGTEALAQAGIGHRTLIVEPTHLAQGFTL
jgi:hypothetical protein